jgi:hypothetical protein
LQKHKSRHFTFQFLKKKLKLKSIYKVWESCSSGYTEHNKIGFAIFGFFNDFICILQVAAETQQRVKKHFARRPLESFKPSQICPWLAQNTLEVSGALQCGPWGLGRCGSPDSGEAGGGDGRGSGWGGSRNCREPV